MAAPSPDIALPLDKLFLVYLNTDGLSGSGSNGKLYVVLVSTGSFNPPTYMHLRCFELARDALISKGFCVIGGCMSPVNDAYKKKDLILAEHRVAMCNLACKSSDFVMLDPWERNGQGVENNISKDDILTEYKDSIIIVDEVVQNGISSTGLR